MNSWDAGLPSRRVWQLECDERAAQARVEAARRGYAEASRATQAFWSNVIEDRLEALRVAQASLAQERAERLSTPDPLERMDLWMDVVVDTARDRRKQ